MSTIGRISTGTLDDPIVEPALEKWPAMLDRADAELGGQSLARWRNSVRQELHLPEASAIIATGHQTLLWHPGILAKFLAVDAVTGGRDLAAVNLVVDQHADHFGSFEVPVRGPGNALGVRRMHLADERRGVPMSLHEPFMPAPPRARWRPALPSVEAGVERIYAAVSAHHDAANAAHQMAMALSDLMSSWVRPMALVPASSLLKTSLGRLLLQSMAEDPEGCARCYNQAVADHPKAGIGPLLIRDDYVELPLWRARPTGQRMRAYDNDVERWLENSETAPPLFPRALMLTALVRLGLCELFVHGTGGANYDRAMEDWIGRWLRVRPAPVAVVSATLRLPLHGDDRPEVPPLPIAEARYRRAWHDPEVPQRGPGAEKRRLLALIAAAPRDSAERRRQFYEMHERLGEFRDEHRHQLERLRDEVAEAERRAEAAPIIARRTWPFPLYEPNEIDRLAAAL